jgi:hypothetical protein
MLGFLFCMIIRFDKLLLENANHIYDFFGSGDPSKTCLQTTALIIAVCYVCAVSTHMEMLVFIVSGSAF